MQMKLPSVHMRDALRDAGTTAAVFAEFLGMMFFQLLAATTNDKPLVTAFTFAGIMYSIKHISGGHLNPVVSFAAAGTGHIDWTRALLYALAQALGAVAGACLQVGLTPHIEFGKGGPGCFRPDHALRGEELFGWELLSTFFFVMVMYSAILARPGHGDAAPIAAGFALYGIAAAAGMYTGNSVVNPSRVFAASLIFGCYWRHMWIYLLAQLLGCIAASLTAYFVYGRGPHLGGAGQRPTEMLRETLMAGEGVGEPEGQGYQGTPFVTRTTT